MAKSGGSLPRGRRRATEVPPVPTSDGLTAVQRDAQAVLSTLVERAGGRIESSDRIAVDHVDTLVDLFNEWALRYGEPADCGHYFSGRPGLWHALDELYPLQDPNRWDQLRLAVIEQLESEDWRRRTPPRGSAFYILR